jgi:phenylacetate-CoA ligase
MAEPCPCGRSSVKMTRVFERIDDMIILNGRNMFPSQFEGILTEAIGMTPNYQLVIDRLDNMDGMEIQIEVSPDIFDDEMKKLNELEIVVVREVKDKFDFIPKVTLVEPRSLKRKMKKSRVIDRRKSK